MKVNNPNDIIRLNKLKEKYRKYIIMTYNGWTFPTGYNKQFEELYNMDLIRFQI